MTAIAMLKVIATNGLTVYDLSLGALASDLPAGEYPLCLAESANACINEAMATPDPVRSQLVSALHSACNAIVATGYSTLDKDAAVARVNAALTAAGAV